MSILMEDSGGQVGTGEFTIRMPTPKEERAIKIMEKNRLKAKRRAE